MPVVCPSARTVFPGGPTWLIMVIFSCCVSKYDLILDKSDASNVQIIPFFVQAWISSPSDYNASDTSLWQMVKGNALTCMLDSVVSKWQLSECWRLTEYSAPINSCLLLLSVAFKIRRWHLSASCVYSNWSDYVKEENKFIIKIVNFEFVQKIKFRI